MGRKLAWIAVELVLSIVFALIILTKESSVASIEISSADESASAMIRITATGPCVTTDGPDSDEVVSLEQ